MIGKLPAVLNFIRESNYIGRIPEDKQGIDKNRLFSPVLLVLMSVFAPDCFASHLSREDPVEPIFTERAFIENNIEMDVNIENGFDGTNLELSPGITWVFWDRFQFGMEIPYGINFQDAGETQSNISDLGLSAKVLLCCDTEKGYRFIALRSDVEIPSGSRSKEIGGEGSFGFSLLGGYGLTVLQSLPDLTLQIELHYEQQLRLSQDQEVLSAVSGLGDTRQKQFDWNIAFAQQLAGGRFNPVFEILGTTVVDAQQAEDEGTMVALSVGSWVVPFPDYHLLDNFSIGFGWQWPVTDRRENEGQGLVIFELAFD